MSLTDVVFDVRDPEFPFAEATASDHGLGVAFRASESTADGFRAVVTLTGSPDAARALIKSQAESGSAYSAHVVGVHDAGTDLLVVAPDAATRALQALRDTRSAFGGASTLVPLAVGGGVTRLRALVPENLEPRDVGRRLRRAVGDAARVTRVAHHEPFQYVNACRGVLTPGEEDVLAVAWRMGYYTKPKGCSLDAIAERFSVSASPVHKRLKSAEQALVHAHVDPRSVAVTRAVPTQRARSAAGRRYSGQSGLREVRVRYRASLTPLARVTAGEPTARALVLPLAGSADNEERHLVLVTGPPATRAAAAEALGESPPTLRVEPVGHAASADLLVVVVARGDPTSWEHHPVPFTAGFAALAPVAFAKCTVIENGDAWVRGVVVEDAGPPMHASRALRAAYTTAVGPETDADVVSARPFLDVPTGLGLTRLTARQEETLRLAHAMGYYRTPRACTLEDVAAALGVSANAVHKNLTAAEAKVVGNHFAGVE